MAQFRAKKLDLSCFINIRVIRDHTKRKVFEEHEVERQALRYIIRNTTLPQRARAQAQLQLSQMHCYTRPTQIKNRCIIGGKGRGVFREFQMARYPFRMLALEGSIPGVKKAQWHNLTLDVKHDSKHLRSPKLVHAGVSGDAVVLKFQPVIDQLVSQHSQRTFSSEHISHVDCQEAFIPSSRALAPTPQLSIFLTSFALNQWIFLCLAAMFRRLESSLPKDFEFPHDLKALGYFVDEHDQIRMISDPQQPFHYRISKNDRAVEMQKEAMEDVIRQIIQTRLFSRGFTARNLPAGTPDTEPHVPIYASSNLAECKALIIYVGESDKSTGLLAGRVVNKETIGKGSVVNFVDSVLKSSFLSTKPTGIIFANPAQLYWHRRGGRPLSWQSWKAIPRPTAVSPSYAVTGKNKVPHNETPEAHVACVFRDVVRPVIEANPTCEVFVIGTGDGWLNAFEHLQHNWADWKDNLAAFAFMNGSYVPEPAFYNKDFMEWWGRRARVYMVSEHPLGTPLQGRSSVGCNVYSGGEEYFEECVLVRAHEAVVGHFESVSQQVDYENVPQTLDEEQKHEKETESTDEKVKKAMAAMKLGDDAWEDPVEEVSKE